MRKHALIVTSPPENAKQKTKSVFFSISTRRLAESVEGFNSSLAAGCWQVIGLQSFAKRVAHAGLKGFKYCIFTCPLLLCVQYSVTYSGGSRPGVWRWQSYRGALKSLHLFKGGSRPGVWGGQSYRGR